MEPWGSEALCLRGSATADEAAVLLGMPERPSFEIMHSVLLRMLGTLSPAIAEEAAEAAAGHAMLLAAFKVWAVAFTAYNLCGAHIHVSFAVVLPLLLAPLPKMRRLRCWACVSALVQEDHAASSPKSSGLHLQILCSFRGYCWMQELHLRGALGMQVATINRMVRRQPWHSQCTASIAGRAGRRYYCLPDSASRAPLKAALMRTTAACAQINNQSAAMAHLQAGAERVLPQIAWPVRAEAAPPMPWATGRACQWTRGMPHAHGSRGIARKLL